MKQKPKLQVLDPVFEEAVNEYAESIIEMEKAEYRPGVEPFEAHAAKVKNKVSETMHAFYDSYTRGYDVLLAQLEKIIPVTDPAVDPLSAYRAKAEHIKKLDDPIEFMNYINAGHSIYEVLGFTHEAIAKFYEAGVQLVEQKRFEDARDGFYFLVTIAPLVGEAWLGLGFAYAECKQQDAAIQALAHAVDLMPNRHDAYLTFARVFIEMHDFEQAQKVCDIGLSYAKEHPTEVWAKDLVTYLEEAKRQIDVLFQKSQYQSYSS